MTPATYPLSNGRSRAARRPLRSDRLAVGAMVAGATAATLLMNAATVAAVLHGAFADPDDAMRLVEVRAWLAGQSWFDMTAVRLDPPVGSFMHWSRLVDLPVAACVAFLGLFTDVAHAERLAGIAVPTLWLAALYAGVLRLATILFGPAGRWPALVGTCLGGATLVQFDPGRIGHHAPETVMLVAAVGCAAAALDPRRAREAAIAGGLVALSLAMSLETLPFLAVLAASLAGFWVLRGCDAAKMLTWFSVGLVVALPLAFLVTVGPARWTAPVCDAFGAAHLGAGLIGAVGALALAQLSARLPSPPLRTAALAVVAALVGIYLLFLYPACLHSPFAGVDPLVRDLWLRHVGESLPLSAFAGLHPMLALAIVAPLGLGCLGCAVAARDTDPMVAARASLVGVVAATGLALGFWQVRVFGSAMPLALCGATHLVLRIGRRFAVGGIGVAGTGAEGIGAEKIGVKVLLAALMAGFTSTAWILVLPPDPLALADSRSAAAKRACLTPEALGPLATLAPGPVVAPIDSGAHLLEATALSVLAAPYHRNDDGNRFAFDVFLARPDAAQALLSRRRVAYVMTCPGTREMARLAARAPDGLAAGLARGEIPAFLRPLPVAGTPYRVYRVEADAR